MIYVGQNAFRLNVDTAIDLSGASTTNIFLRYSSPSLSTGHYLPTVADSTAGTMYYDFTSTQSLEAGVWVLWAYVVHVDNRVSIGDPFEMTVKAEGAL